MAKEWRIMGSYQRRNKEELDTADADNSVTFLLGEYRMAYGAGWTIWAEDRNGVHFDEAAAAAS